MSTSSEFIPCTVRARHEETPDMVRLVLNPKDPVLIGSYTAPGQFVELRAEPSGKGAFMVITSPPGGVALEFLVKRGGAAADTLLAVTEGGMLHSSPVQGKGFPLDQARGKDLVMMSIGSGIAALRPVIDHALEKRESFGQITLLNGARTSRDLPFRADLERWRKEGLNILLSLSGADETWEGPRGHVQEHLTDQILASGNAAIMLCGSKDFEAGVRSKLVDLGQEEIPILKNY